MLTVWGRKTSSNVQAVMWCIGELKLDNKRLDIGFNFGGTDTAEFIVLNPNRRVPVLQDTTDTPIWESAAILRYLASRYGSDSFWPTDPTARAQVDKWAEWAKLLGTVHFTTPIFWAVVRTAPANQNPAAIKTAVTEFETLLQLAETQLSQHAFLVSDDFTLADILFGHLLFRYYEMEIERCDLPLLQRYYQNLQTRAAFREHVMISYEVLRVR